MTIVVHLKVIELSFFDNNGKIIMNKKHYKTFHMITGLNKYGYISAGVIVVVALVVGPFPALL